MSKRTTKANVTKTEVVPTNVLRLPATKVYQKDMTPKLKVEAMAFAVVDEAGETIA